VTDVSGWAFVASRFPELAFRTGEHLILTGLSTGLAIAAGIPLGIIASRRASLRTVVLGLAGVLQTVPSLAMLALLLAVLDKIGATPAIIALTLYALLPIVRNTLAGLESVSTEVLEAAKGIGMTARQQLFMVELPLALPIIVAGVRTAAVVGVGIATLSAFIGAGGLGQFINRGLSLANTDLILLGAIPAGLLALLVDFSLGAVAWGLRPLRQKDKGTWKALLRPVAWCMPLLLVGLGLAAAFGGGIESPAGPRPHTDLSGGVVQGGVIRIGSKNFTEQLVVGELIAQIIEERTSYRVQRYFNLGGTMICHQALVGNEIDLYVEYTGTAWTAILKRRTTGDPKQLLREVRQVYRARFNLEWLNPLGFNNTYTITVREDDANLRGWETLSDLARDARGLNAGFTAEFSERPDGYPGLRDAYDLHFSGIKDLDPSLMYEAIARREVDVICAFATDGRIDAYGLKPLIDESRYFPPYHAAPVVRRELLSGHPQIRRALESLAGMLDDDTMRRLNSEVDLEKLSPDEVVRDFLTSQGHFR
jgi:osmoprotectant transport system permease protein